MLTGSSFIILLVYVNDIIVVSNDSQVVQDFKVSSQSIQNKGLGQSQMFLGLGCSTHK